MSINITEVIKELEQCRVVLQRYKIDCGNLDIAIEKIKKKGVNS